MEQILHISTAQARRFLLRSQLLDPPQSLRGPDAVNTVFKHLRLIQYDPLNPCGRNPDLVLQSRIADYHPNDYLKWLYIEKKGIDCYDRELCIIPLEDFPLVTYRHLHTKKHPRIAPFLKQFQKQIELLMHRIEKTGPISSADIQDKTRVDSGWGDTALFGRIALESLWRIGRLVIVKRDGSRKYYDLPHRHYHDMALQDKPSQKIREEHVLRRVKSVGILSKTRYGGGFQQLGTAKEVTTLIERLIRKNDLIEVEVSGSKRPYVIATADRNQLERIVNEPPIQARMTFIAPLDNLIWDRQMIVDFFGFEYRWEVYTPSAKRKYGYYALPILYGDRFIGRIEPVLNKQGDLEIRGLWKEFAWDSQMEHDYNRALIRFKEYLLASRISGISSA